MEGVREFPLVERPGAVFVLFGDKSECKSQMLQELVETLSANSLFACAFIHAPRQPIPAFTLRKWNVFSSHSSEDLDSLLKEVKKRVCERMEAGLRPEPWLLVLTRSSHLMHTLAAKEFIMCGRHYGCTIILTCRTPGDLPRHVRENCDVVFCFEESDAETRKHTRECFCNSSKREFAAVFSEFAKGDSALVIDRCQRNEQMFWRRSKCGQPVFKKSDDKDQFCLAVKLTEDP